MIDVRCAAAGARDHEQVDAIDATRAYRLVLAVIGRDTDAYTAVIAETTGCMDCLLGLIAGLSGKFAWEYVGAMGIDAATAHVTRMLGEQLSRAIG